MTNYILVDGEPVACEDIHDWAIWMEGANDQRQLARDGNDDEFVSTVFLGIDHSFGGPVPILWETMIFGGEHDQWQKRARTKAEAMKHHTEACQLAGIRMKIKRWK